MIDYTRIPIADYQRMHLCGLYMKLPENVVDKFKHNKGIEMITRIEGVVEAKLTPMRIIPGYQLLTIISRNEERCIYAYKHLMDISGVQEALNIFDAIKTTPFQWIYIGANNMNGNLMYEKYENDSLPAVIYRERDAFYNILVCTEIKPRKADEYTRNTKITNYYKNWVPFKYFTVTRHIQTILDKMNRHDIANLEVNVSPGKCTILDRSNQHDSLILCVTNSYLDHLQLSREKLLPRYCNALNASVAIQLYGELERLGFKNTNADTPLVYTNVHILDKTLRKMIYVRFTENDNDIQIISVRIDKVKLASFTVVTGSFYDCRLSLTSYVEDFTQLGAETQAILQNCWKDRDNKGGIATADGKYGLFLSVIKNTYHGLIWTKKIKTKFGSGVIEIKTKQMLEKIAPGDWQDCMEIDIKVYIKGLIYTSESIFFILETVKSIINQINIYE